MKLKAENFSIFTRKQLCWCLVFDKISKIEKFLKPHQKTSVGVSRFYQSYRLKKFAIFTRKHQFRSLIFNKVGGWRHNINIKSLIHFSIAPLIQNPKLSAAFCCVVLLITENSNSCYRSNSIISNIGGSGDGLQKPLKIFEVDGFFSSIQS